MTIINSLTQFIQLNAQPVNIASDNLTSELIKEIQRCLRINADGIVGNITKQAFQDFKSDNYLQFPLILGVTTAKELLEELDKEDDEENDEIKEPSGIILNPNAGVRTGKSMRLPNGDTVFENQYIVPSIPLTWGEMTKKCSRVPTISEYVRNALRYANAWGFVRDKFDSPIYKSSGYRPPNVNTAVGGVRNSLHQYFLAGDDVPMNGNFRKLWEVYLVSDFVGLGDAVFMGRNKGFFHGDLRSGQRIIFPY